VQGPIRVQGPGERSGTVVPVSELRSTIEALRAEVLPEQPDAQLEEDFLELHRAIEQLEAQRLRRLAEIDRRRSFARDGHLSVASWLVARLPLAWGAARGQARMARALEVMPATRRGLEAGELPLAACRVLADAHHLDPEAFARTEPQLVEAARRHQVGDLHRVITHWRERTSAEAGDPESGRLAARRLHASRTFLGMVRVDADLDPETGGSLLAALGAVLDAEARTPDHDDRRTPAQRRADALGEICRGWLDLAERPTVAGERPHLQVLVEAAALGGRSNGGDHRRAEATAELDHVGSVDPATVRRLACDAAITRVVMAGRSEPLDVGRRTPVVPPAMRRAVVVRDRGCRFPGCDRPHAWCDAHHVIHWADGGPTAVRNLLLLCRRHHRAVHAGGGFRLELLDGRPVFRRPDGSVLEDRAPP
jgi:hypothetical protein